MNTSLMEKEGQKDARRSPQKLFRCSRFSVQVRNETKRRRQIELHSHIELEMHKFTYQQSNRHNGKRWQHCDKSLAERKETTNANENKQIYKIIV